MVEHGKSVQGVQSKLDEANSTLDTLKKSNTQQDLQNELKTYKERVSQLEADAKETTKKQIIDALPTLKQHY